MIDNKNNVIFNSSTEELLKQANLKIKQQEEEIQKLFIENRIMKNDAKYLYTEQQVYNEVKENVGYEIKKYNKVISVLLKYINKEELEDAICEVIQELKA